MKNKCKIKILNKFNVFILLLFFSCKKINKVHYVSKISSGNSYNSDIKKNNQHVKKNKKSILLVTVNGLTSKLKKNTLKDLKNIGFDFVLNNFKKKIKNYNIYTYRHPPLCNAAEVSFHKSADYLFKRIKHYLKQNQLESDTPIILMSSSSGCLTCYLLYMKFKSQLNIKGIIAFNGAWKGLHIVKKLNSSPFLMFIRNILLKQYKNSNIGIQELYPSSELLSSVKKDLYTCKIPILAIANQSSLIPKILNLPIAQKLFKSKKPNSFLFNSENHDGLIEIESQTADGLPNIHSVILKKNCTHGYFYKRYFTKFYKKFDFFNKDEKERKAINKLITHEIAEPYITKEANDLIIDFVKNKIFKEI